MSNLIVVLHRPQKLVNIGGTIRAMKNMGLTRLRLVAPDAFDPVAIDAVAHRSQDILARTEIYADLDAALADTTFVVGTTARQHAGFAPAATPRVVAPQILAYAQTGSVALLFGPEDTGLTNAELDRCHQLVTIPTDPTYASLNLAQAVLIMAYELYLAGTAPVVSPAHPETATSGELQHFFQAAESALQAIQFFKTNHASPHTMRLLRKLIHRATPTSREVALLTAIMREIMHYGRRMHKND